MGIALRRILLEIPSSDFSLIEEIALRLGWNVKETDTNEIVSNNASTKKYSERIDRIRSLGGIKIDPKEIEKDERLKYLLNK
jgi:hypothetical protein